MDEKQFVNILKKTEDKDTLIDLIFAFKKFPFEKREKIKKILNKEYLRFLEEGEKEKDFLKIKKLCSWLIARKRFGLPYDGEKVREIIEREKNLEDLRNRIYEAIKESYDENLDRKCCEKLSIQARKEKRRIVCGRFSRAFYIDALLLANSKLLPSSKVFPLLKDLEKIVEKSQIDISPIKSEIQFLEKLVSEKEIPFAQLIHGLKNLKDSLRNFEFNLVREFEEGAKINIKKKREIFDKIRYKIKEIEKKISEIPSRCPVYMIFFQRIFPIDAIYMGLLNELKEPFFGEDPEIEELLANGGENIYVTPDMKDFLQVCDDWIEALPAYASYRILPEDGTYRFTIEVQRNILEEMYRSMAEYWALNIEEVMMTENVSIAREILGNLLKIKWKDEEDLIGKLDGKIKEISYLSALVEKSYENMIERIVEICEKKKVLRYDALKEAIENIEEGNILKEFLKKYDRKRSLKKQLEKFLEEKNILSLSEKYFKYADFPRRELPSIHVLTTLGPGETEYNVKNWIEEGMLLSNIIRKYNLQKYVDERVNVWRENLIKIGERVIKEVKMEDEIYGLSGEEKKEKILRLIFTYPEIKEEVTKISLLLQKEGKNLNEKISSIEEPQIVIEELSKINPELIGKEEFEEEEFKILKEVREKCIEKAGLDNEKKDFLKNYLHPAYSKINAQKQVIIEKGLMKELSNPLFRYEATGPFKRYNLLYTPSRVDLGAKEVSSVRDIPKWVGGIDEISANAGKKLYQLYNVAGPVIIPSTKIAEFLKVGENFFSRGGVYYLSLIAGINLDTLKIGDFEFFRNQWNARGDRKVLPSGETYGGFCVPKEFTLLYAMVITCIDEEASSKILSSLGIPQNLQKELIEDFKKVISWRKDMESEIEWEKKAFEYLNRKYPEYFKITGRPFCLPRFPQIAKTLENLGILKEDKTDFKFTYWVNKKAQGLEEINRTGPFRKVKLIYELVEEARRKTPDLPDNDELIGVMAVNYKESEIKDGKLIPVSDVRFSAGCRKLEIYSKVAERHILLDIDPEGRRIIQEMFKDFVPPADIRIVGRCTGSDILNYVPDSCLSKIKEEVENYLLDIGLDENVITANSLVYGGDLKKWVGIRDLPDEKKRKILKDLEGKIHLLVIDKRGPFISYEEALQGVDFVDLGIPDPELLDLIDNLPKMIYLMKIGRPNSCLVFADGTSGARRPSFAFRYPTCRRKVKELFALEERAVYGCLGIGKEVIEGWREEMEIERNLSREFLDALMNEDKKRCQDTLSKIIEDVVLKRKFDVSLLEEKQAKELNIWSLRERYITDTFFSLSTGIKLKDFDFGKWIIYGGMYLLNGKMEKEEILNLRKEYGRKLRKIAGIPGDKSYKDSEIDFIMENFIRPLYHPPKEFKYRELSTGLAGSLKAVEEKAVRIKRWEERKREFRKLMFQKEKEEGYRKEVKVVSPDLDTLYKESKKILGNGRERIKPYTFGKFLKLTHLYLENLNRKIVHYGGKSLLGEIKELFGEKLFSEENYLPFAIKLASSAELKKDRKFYEEICGGLELLDISLLIEKTSNLESEEEFNTEIARFFDITLNSHIFDCFPYHFSKEHSSAFEKLERKEKFELAVKYHRWLYTYLRYLITTSTPLKDFPEKYKDLYLGDWDRKINGIGIRGDNEEEIFWYHYVRLRDAVVLKHEGFGYPEIIENIEPSDLNINERANVGIIYPYGNTTVPVALQQGPKLAEEKINLFLTAFPIPLSKNGKKILTIQEGMFYPGKDDYRKLKEKYSSLGESKENFVFGTFKKPLVLHGIFFHFTHPLRPYIDSFQIPIIQPLIWEAATYLKCKLPEMLKGSGVKAPEQENWYMEDTQRLKEKAKINIKKKIKKLAKKYPILIVKPEKESGGRKALILPVKEKGKYINENIEQLSEQVYEISKTDNVVIQQVIESRVRQLYSKEFLEKLVERFARIGIPVLLDREPKTPLYSYFRQIVVYGDKGYEISHHITVISTRGIANVGQGGLLFEYTDEIINPKYRKDLREQITRAVFKSLESQRKYLRENWREILEEYLKIYPEFAEKIRYESIFEDLSGFRIDDIPYEMGDYMPVFLVDEDDNLKYIYDYEKEEILPLYDENGYPTSVKIYDENGNEIKRVDDKGNAIFVKLFEGDKKRKIYDGKGNEIPSLIIYKIETNPGAGLWRPHNDQLPPERKGEGVFIIFKNLGKRAKIYKTSIEKLLDI